MPTESRYEDGGDILLKVIEEEDAEYGGVLDDVRWDVLRTGRGGEGGAQWNVNLARRGWIGGGSGPLA